MSYVAVYLNAGNDKNGNPCRGWAIVKTQGGLTVEFVNEGYSGRDALKRRWFGIEETGQFEITRREYRRLLKLDKSHV